MDQRLNPYTPGSGIKPLKLAGRDGDLEAFRVLLVRLASGQPERSLIYSGLRGVVKTILLLEFETLAREAGWVLRKDLVYSPRRGLVDFTVPLFAAYLRAQHPLASFTDDG